MKKRLKAQRMFWYALLGASVSLGACHKPRANASPTTSLATFTGGMVSYLKVRGDLCLGKEFPLDVSEREFQAGSRNALQMPVLEHLGLLTSSDAVGQATTDDGPVPVRVRRYELTDAGRKYYLAREVPGQKTSAGQPVLRSDLCVAKLSLDKVLSWELSPAGERPGAVVTYTYRVEAAPWTQNSEVKQVFPAVDRVVTGAGVAQLKEAFTLTGSGWVANELALQSLHAIAKR